MPIPKFNETMLPILKIVSDWEEYTLIEIVEKLYKVFSISEEEKQLKSQNWWWAFYNKVWWWKSYLKQAWLIEYPKRWSFRITDEWKKVLKENLSEISVNYLKKYSSFLNFITPNKSEKLEEKDTDLVENLTPNELIETWYKKILSSLENDLHEQLLKSNPYFFEEIILKLFNKMGYWEFLQTSKSNDWWIDGIINEDDLGLSKIYTQAKRYTNSKVWEKEIRNFIWAMSSEVNKWIFVTTSDFDKKAIEKARFATQKIVLINWEKLVKLMIKYNVWVQVKNTYEIKEIDLDFFNVDEF